MGWGSPHQKIKGRQGAFRPDSNSDEALYLYFSEKAMFFHKKCGIILILWAGAAFRSYRRGNPYPLCLASLAISPDKGSRPLRSPVGNALCLRKTGRNKGNDLSCPPSGCVSWRAAFGRPLNAPLDALCCTGWLGPMPTSGRPLVCLLRLTPPHRKNVRKPP